MKIRDYFLLFIAGLIISSLMLFIRPYTGYMDADYYFGTAREIASGHGFVQNFLWNYLDNPASISHPAFTYWMPLSSIIAAMGLWFFRSNDLLYSRIPFVLIFSFVPVITAMMAYRITSSRSSAWVAGILGIFCGYYLRFISEPDSFGVTMILGPLIIILAGSTPLPARKTWVLPLSIGVLCGLMHLARADGILWLLIGTTGLIYSYRVFEKSSEDHTVTHFPFWKFLYGVGLLVLGYVVITIPWYIRNLEYFGAPFPPGNSRTLFLSEYAQVFSFPAASITFQTWWNGGISRIISGIISATGTNLASAFVVQSNIVMLPLVFIGMYNKKSTPIMRLAFFAWLITFISMSVVFPYAGSRGGYLHSGAAIQPLIWAYAALGLSIVVQKGIEWRKWNSKIATRLFNSFAILLALIISGYVVWGDKINAQKSISANQWEDYKLIDNYIGQYLFVLDYSVMVNNPPAYTDATDQPAVVIPYGNIATLNHVASKYAVNYLIIDQNHIQNYEVLYKVPQDYDNLIYLGSVKDYRIYEFTK
jgi:hypothetical protein